MRYIRYAFLAILAICLVTVAVANRGVVTLLLLPPEMSGFLGWSWSVTMPLFLLIFGAIVVGVMIGFVWEWLREHKHRADATRQRRQKEELAREVTRLKTPPPGKGDDVLALIDGPGATAR
ncbi:LapA family protein [Oceaniovalibus sp. ACAM 378]|uniref:LapA family protein n=1 Tax=Oceaniovalibus sp. ACAM 378 TaxID=2599923 RepID=UPI0011D5DAAF|nr:LapA family protein [Oceaniovalibus sp. ACAM 378]TYB87132.1 LapA family protein [Oceaniovalibus sp. ACAM 378]